MFVIGKTSLNKAVKERRIAFGYICDIYK